MNRKLSSFFCDPWQAFKNVLLFALMILLVVYAGFQVFPAFTQKIETETALMVTVHETDKTVGYIFRNEEPIAADAFGVPVMLLKDGERVSAGEHFANVYTESDAAHLQEQIGAIDRKIEVLSKSVVTTDLYVTDISKTDAEIEKSFDALFADTAAGNLAGTVGTANSLLVSLNKKALIIDMNDGYESEIASLRTERNALESRISAASRRLTAPVSGYYYGDTDGYERIFKPELLDDLTMESFNTLAASEPATTNADFGKIVKDFVWYIVCETDRHTAAAYQTDHYYRLNFPAFSEDEIKMELVRIVSETSSDEGLLIFRGNTAPEGFPYLRSQEVDIITDGYTGLAIPKEALRVADGKQGVYILDGDIVRFRLVNILTENDDYYIVSPQAPETDAFSDATENSSSDARTYYYLSLYDSVIVKGKSLFDGKIVG